MDYYAISTFGVSVGLAVLLFWLASRQMVAETKKLQFYNELILKALHNSGLADLNFDKDGNVIGMKIHIKVPAGGISFGGKGTLSNRGDDVG